MLPWMLVEVVNLLWLREFLFEPCDCSEIWWLYFSIKYCAFFNWNRHFKLFLFFLLFRFFFLFLLPLGIRSVDCSGSRWCENLFFTAFIDEYRCCQRLVVSNWLMVVVVCVHERRVGWDSLLLGWSGVPWISYVQTISITAFLAVQTTSSSLRLCQSWNLRLHLSLCQRLRLSQHIRATLSPIVCFPSS